MRWHQFVWKWGVQNTRGGEWNHEEEWGDCGKEGSLVVSHHNKVSWKYQSSLQVVKVTDMILVVLWTGISSWHLCIYSLLILRKGGRSFLHSKLSSISVFTVIHRWYVTIWRQEICYLNVIQVIIIIKKIVFIKMIPLSLVDSANVQERGLCWFLK